MGLLKRLGLQSGPPIDPEYYEVLDVQKLCGSK